MVKIRFTEFPESPLTLVIRDHTLTEVWRGVLVNSEQEIDLPKGEYLLETHGIGGRKTISISCSENDQVLNLQTMGNRFEIVDKESHANEVITKPTVDSTAMVLDSISSYHSDNVQSVSKTDNRQLQSGSFTRKNLQRLMKQTQFDELTRLGKYSNASERCLHTRFSIWSRQTSGAWKLNTHPDHKQLRSGSGLPRFLRISCRGQRPTLVSMPESIVSISIPVQAEFEGGVVLNEPDSLGLALRAMIERKAYRDAVLLAIENTKTTDMSTSSAAQTALAAVSMFSELTDKEKPSIDWFESIVLNTPHLSDPLIAYAWYGIYLSVLEETEICRALLESVERGIPHLVGSLALLRRGLELLARNDASAAVVNALDKVRNWSDHLVPKTFLTTFYGTGKQILSGSQPQAAVASDYQLPGVSLKSLGYTLEGDFITIGLDQ